MSNIISPLRRRKIVGQKTFQYVFRMREELKLFSVAFMVLKFKFEEYI